jgi:hypothetical protein
VRRGPGRDPRRRNPGPAAGARSAPREREDMDAARHGAGHRRNRGDRRPRGPLAGHAGHAAAGAGQPVRPGRTGDRHPGRTAGRPAGRGRSQGRSRSRRRSQGRSRPWRRDPRRPGRGHRLRHRGPGPDRGPAGPDDRGRTAAARGPAHRGPRADHLAA